MYYRANNDTLLAYCEKENNMFTDWKYTDLVTSEQLDKDRMLIKIVNGELILNPNYDEEKAHEEAERIANLYLTRADVERALVRAVNIDFDDILEGVKAKTPDKYKLVKAELGANNFYRGNPYVNLLGAELGFTEKQLDDFFIQANNEETKQDAWKVLVPPIPEEVVPEEKVKKVESKKK